ncbi:MAG: hypothetical protein K2L45_11665 [Muribaculaceae bacterium]|nr:hypothetical protein [Muribaculaceae bacterium]
MEVKYLISTFIAFIVGIYIQTISAQVTNYYALSKIIDFDKESTQCKGGQFVKISKNICYDVDANGNDVGNGKLYRDLGDTTCDIVYIGYSFHGKCRYIFNSDYSSLTVEINPHCKYVYKKTSIPVGVYTCSLIKKKSGGGGETRSPVNSSAYSAYPQAGINQNVNTNRISNPSKTIPIPRRDFKCAHCNGTGRIEKNDNASASFGTQKPRQRCNDCGKWYDPNVFVHYHQQCRHCGGTGKTK